MDALFNGFCFLLFLFLLSTITTSTFSTIVIVLLEVIHTQKRQSTYPMNKVKSIPTPNTEMQKRMKNTQNTLTPTPNRTPVITLPIILLDWKIAKNMPEYIPRSDPAISVKNCPWATITFRYMSLNDNDERTCPEGTCPPSQ